jgi:molybdate transport system regulatory protein
MAPSRRSDPPRPALKGRIALETPLGAVLSESRIRLLEAIERCGSLNRAAGEVPLSYKAAWDALDAMNKLSPAPLVERSTGGVGGGGTRLTDYAKQLIALYRAMESSQQDVLDRIKMAPAEHDAPTLRTLIRRMTMKTSARNQLPARVSGLSDHGGLVEVQLTLGEPDTPGETMMATITPESAESMGLTLGCELFVLVKAPSVHVSASAPRRAAGRNVLAGSIAALRPGSAHTGVTLALPSGASLQAVAPHEQAAELTVGQPAWAQFSSDNVVLVTFG